MTILSDIKSLYYRFRYPDNIWYGGGIKRENALRHINIGWNKLINNLYDAKPKNTKIIDIKEKYGTLCISATNCPEWYDDLISYYEYRSGNICEQCGNSGKLRIDRHWILTLCDECNEKV